MDQAVRWKARVDAGLQPGEQAELDAWLEADEVNRSALARLDRVWDRFDRPFQGNAADQLLQELQKRARRRRGRAWSAAAVATGVLVVLGGLFWSRAQPAGLPLFAPAVAAAAQPASSVVLLPERRTLPDGSIVELRAGGEIAVQFTPALRRVTLLKGEAHFQVAKNPARPFVVTAGKVEARAVGTAFAVELRSREVEVLVTEGVVSVNESADTESPAVPAITSLARLEIGTSLVIPVDLAAGRSVDLTGRILPLDAGALRERLAWRSPRVEFTRTTLAEAVALLNGYAAGRRASGENNRQFYVADAELNQLRISGLFRVDNTRAFIGFLQDGFDIAVDESQAGEIVLRRATR